MGRAAFQAEPLQDQTAIAVVSTDMLVPDNVLGELKTNAAVKIARSIQLD